MFEIGLKEHGEHFLKQQEPAAEFLGGLAFGAGVENTETY